MRITPSSQRRIAALKSPKRSNCICWVIFLVRKRGGYLSGRQSIHNPLIFHTFWSRDQKTWWSYAPINPKRGWRVMIDALWFRGHVVIGDDHAPHTASPTATAAADRKSVV